MTRPTLGDVPGVLCLQGGREFTPDCREMDALVLARSAAGTADRPVAVLAGAARTGSDHDAAVDRARGHYEALGATTVGIPDPRTDLRAALTALAQPIGLLVLPGGSPTSLMDVLAGSTPDVGERIVTAHLDGMSISGASAGAMVLCDWCVLPDRGRGRRTAVTQGLSLAEGLALPHWSPAEDRWSMPDDVHLWGLPECGGVVIDGQCVEGVGHGVASFRHAGADWLPVIRPTAVAHA